MCAASVDILTVSARPEMEEMCRWLYARQDYQGDLLHTYDLSTIAGSAGDRRGKQLELLRTSSADLFMLTDDDDYVDPGFITRAIAGVREGMYGEIVMRTYLLTEPAYGETFNPRDFPFITMMIFDRKRWQHAMLEAIAANNSRSILRRGGPWLLSNHWIIMRGLMADPTTAITARKNHYHERHFPHRDEGYGKLREWLREDPAAFARYMAMTEKGKQS